jgi:hypothetical protein
MFKSFEKQRRSFYEKRITRSLFSGDLKAGKGISRVSWELRKKLSLWRFGDESRLFTEPLY